MKWAQNHSTSYKDYLFNKGTTISAEGRKRKKITFWEIVFTALRK